MRPIQVRLLRRADASDKQRCQQVHCSVGKRVHYPASTSTTKIRLFRSSSKPTRNGIHPTKPAMPVNKQAHVVIVEDDPDVRDSLCAIITALGHQCVAFESAEKTLSYHELSDCDCLLVDFNLPGMSGTDFLQQVQQVGNPPPACLYTGRVDPRIHDAAAGLKNTLVLEKGNDANSIANYLQQLLDQSH